MIQHYRGRNEHLMAELKQSRAAINSRWRGSYSLLAAVTKPASEASRGFFAPQARKFWDFKLF